MSGPDRMAEPVSEADVRRVFGDVLDWKVAAIAASGATVAELEAAAAWLGGLDDEMGEARHPLTGAAAVVYDLLVRAEEFQQED